MVLFSEAMRIGEVGGVGQTTITMWFLAIRSILDFPNSLHMGAVFQKSVGHLEFWAGRCQGDITTHAAISKILRILRWALDTTQWNAR